MLVDLRVAQFLCSRLCHDLAGPLGAVNAGLELMGDQATDTQEALSLLARGAAEATRRLAFFRMAFGLGGGAGTMTLGAARDLAAGLLAEGRVTLDWPSEATAAAGTVPAAAGKLILNLVLLGVESLPRGGSVRVRFADLAEGLGVAVSAVGPGAGLRPDLRAAMAPGAGVDALSAKVVHGYLARRLAEEFGAAIEVAEDGEGETRLAVLLPADRLGLHG